MNFVQRDKKIKQQKKMERMELLQACDEARDRLIPLGIELKDHGKQTSSSFSSLGDKKSESNNS